jgi:drug/metabolite transporter (DMT)-like permease
MAFTKTLVAPLVLTVCGGAFYHVAAKSIPKTIDAALVLVVAYAAALVASIAAYLLMPAAVTDAPAVRPWHPAVIGVGAGAFLIELGYVLTYRAGWPVSLASVLTNGLVAMLLVPIGIVIFGERLSMVNCAGIVLCLMGLALLHR